MSDFRIRIDFDGIPAHMAQMDRAAENAVSAVAETLSGEITTSVQRRSASSGPVMRYQPRRVVFPAAEGQPPNTDTGNLVASVQVEDAGRLRRRVVIGAEYAEALEFGGHPFVEPAVERTERQAPRIVQAIMSQLAD